MADRYWVGGTANWDGTAGTKWATSSGGTGGASVPTSADDVFFSNLSTGTCTIATGNTGAKSINCTGFTGTIAGNATIVLAGNITLVAGMGFTYTGQVGWTSASVSATIVSAGKTFGNVTFTSVGGTLTLGDNLICSTLTISNGTFDTAGYNITAANLVSTNANTRTINLNGSTITISGAVNLTTITNLTFNAGTSQINLSSASGTLSGGGLTFHNVSFTSTSLGTRTIDGANTFNNLTLANSSSSGLVILSVSTNQIVNGTFTCQGASSISRNFVISNTLGTARTITAASVSATDCDFRDITIAGAAAPISPTRAGNCGGNSGITFPAAKTVYRVGTNSAWQGSNSWALTTGGTGSNDNFPLAQDTAVVNNDTTLTGTLSLGVSYNIGAFDCSNRTTALILSYIVASSFYGSHTLGAGITSSASATQTFFGRGTQTFTSAGKTITFPITVNAITGSFELGDAFNSSQLINFLSGTINAKNYNLTCANFQATNSVARTLTMGSGLWTLSGTGAVWSINATNLTFNKDTANILISDTSTNNKNFGGGGLTYNELTIGGTTGTATYAMSGNNTFSALNSTKTVAHRISFGAGSTTTIGTWNVTGTAGNEVTVFCTTTGLTATVNITNRTSGIDYLDIARLTFNRTPVTFYAGVNSKLREAVIGAACITPTANEFIYVLNSGTSFTVPADWNSSSNEIHLFAGGGGGSGSYASGNNRAGGAGGGGGGYTKVTNLTLTPSSSVSYAIGAAGNGGAANANGTAGGNTTFNAGAFTTSGGGGGQASTAPASTGGTAGTGSTFNGGIGGAGATSTAANTGDGGGGGAGAGGSLGAGANGGNGFASTTGGQLAGGGGGGNGGGTAGGNASASTGGTGGNNNAGVGGGAGAGFNGGGSGGTVDAVSPAFFGSSGIDISKAGMGSGSGSGGTGAGVTPALSGIFGGGGGGSGLSTAGVTGTGGLGSQGGIIIVYSAGAAPVANSNFFLMFG
jgi:hypothetical protein